MFKNQNGNLACIRYKQFLKTPRKIMIRTITILILLFFRIYDSQSQSKISITIDDVPNYKTTYNLIKVLDKLNIPIFIFVNEGRPTRDSSPLSTNILLEKWL
jgi:peptidoglycan/xylan/chitin deacetylase (PgdA/CDA1 family)